MAKSDCNLEEINLESAYNSQTKPKWSDGKDINAFDTETHNGNVFMLSYAIGDDFHGVVDNHKIESLSGERIFEKLTHRSCRSNLNFWFNLDFDVNAILSGILNEMQLSQLAITNRTITEVGDMKYEISYVKGKFLTIEDEHRNKYEHFDISQFFYSTLDKASKEWLGEKKIDKVDTSKFGKSVCDNHTEIVEDCSECWNNEQARNYILEHYSTIKEYAVKDAVLTKRLGYELVKEAEKLDIPMGRPFSTGYMSAEYQRANMESKPRFGKRKYQSMFWDSYYGGRFEVFERGNVGDIVAPDINSAYPAVMRNLPDPNTLTWKHYCNTLVKDDLDNEPQPFDLETLKEADYGVVNVTVTTNKHKRIQPFAYKMDGKVKYPVMENTEITVIKPIFEFAVENGYVEDYMLNEAWLGYEIEETQYPFTWINDQYADRKEFAQLEKFKKEMLVKIVLNSGYGKTCQTTEGKRIVEIDDNDIYECEENEKVYPSVFLSEKQRSYLGDNQVVISSQRCGKRFNPFIASYITGMTRLKLHESVVRYGLEKDTYMFATDCIMVDKSAYEKSNFGELIKTPNFDLEGSKFRQSAKDSLGWWDFDYEGSAFIVGSGVYEVEFGECQKGCNGKCTNDEHKRKTKTRGFTEKSLNKSLKELARDNPKGIPIENERPLTIPEVLISPNEGNVSEFVKKSKQLNPDFDVKRRWNIEEPDFEDLLDMREDSKPLILQHEMVDKYTPNNTNFKEAEKAVKGILYQ